ncbi:MAG: hypothetical protein WCW77_05965 [Patescibacteria group bacterium]|jgi:hypothetical protein
MRIEKIEPYDRSDIHVPPMETPAAEEQEAERKKLINMLDEKIAVIDGFLSNGVVGRVAKFEECSVLVDNLYTIRANLKRLIPSIADNNYEIIGDCFLEDRLGGLDMSLGLVRRLAQGKSRNKEFIENCERMSVDFRRYFDVCLKNEELLRLSLETREGPENYSN